MNTGVFIVYLLHMVVALHSQEIVNATANGPCCAECPGGSQNCIEQFLQGIFAEPCTVTICKRLALEIIDGDSETGLDLNTISGIVEVSFIDLELGSVSNGCSCVLGLYT